MDLKDSIKLKRIVAEINIERKTKGYSIYKGLFRLRLFFFIYNKNYIKLKSTLNNYYSQVPVLDDSTKRHFRQKLIISDFHNLLTSARTFVEKYDSQNLDDKFHCFVKELRNYIVHEDFFPLSSKYSKRRRYETLQVDKLEDYLHSQIEKYNNKRKGLQNALDFLQEKEQYLNLNEILIEYNLKLKSLYEQSILELVRENKETLNELLERAESINYEADQISFAKPCLLTKVAVRHLKYLLRKVSV